MAVAGILFAAVIVLILVAAALLDRQDRHHGRRTRIRMASWLEREAQVNAANTPEAYLLDMKGTGNAYSTDALRGEREERRI